MRVFVIGTGRCGSLSLARWFQDHGVRTEMERHAELLCRQAVYKLSRGSWDHGVLNVVWARSPSHGVSVDNNLGLFVENLAVMGPCRFVWLIRNPWDCIASLMAWKWYRKPNDIEPDDVFANNRLTAYDADEMSGYEWEALGNLGKCAWYWKFLNLRIERQLEALDEDCWVRVRLEDWSPAIARSLLRSVGSVDGDVTDWPLPKMNAGPRGRDRPRWTKDEVALVTEVAGKTLARWYPERNFQMPVTRTRASGR